jgi:hypothetical protein
MADHKHRETNGFSEADIQREPEPLFERLPTEGQEEESSLAPHTEATGPQQVSAEAPSSAPGVEEQEPDWHVEAGRKGGQRFHQLIQRGLQYEQEHGLKRGRQRLRQLVQEGRLYEQEHGLAPKGRKPRGGRLSRVRSDQLLQALCRILSRLAKPAHRENIAKMLEALDGENKE